MADARTFSSSMPRPSSQTSRTTVPPADFADTVTVARGGFPRGDPLFRRLAAVVDRVDEQVLERVGDAVQNLLVELDILTDEVQADVLAGGAGDVAHQPWERRDDPADRHHRKTHRAVAHDTKPATGVLDEFSQLVARGVQLLTNRDDAVHRELGFFRQLRPGGGERLAKGAQPTVLLGDERDDLDGVLLDAPGVEFRLADDVEQVVHPLRRDAHAVEGALAAVQAER